MTEREEVGSEPGGKLRISLEDYEADLLRGLTKEMEQLLEAEIEVDPVYQRLFPDAYEDDEAAATYRELVGSELRTGKLTALDTVKKTLGESGAAESGLSPQEAEHWLTVLTDMRLAIGTRMDVTEERMAATIDLDDPDAPALSVLHWLGWLQESVLGAMAQAQSSG